MPKEAETRESGAKAKAGHLEILGETIAKFEFFEQGWNPYSRYLDVDKVDLILRRNDKGQTIFREIQVKYGKLYEVGGAIKSLFDFTSWRFFRENEFEKQMNQRNFFIAYVLARHPAQDAGYQGDIFIFPVRDFVEKIILNGIRLKNAQRKVYLTHAKGDGQRWYLRRKHTFEEISHRTCLDVSKYRRNFSALR